jgi:hypothetical protein
MAKEKGGNENRIRQALGAQRVVPVTGLPSQGPLDLLQLRAELNRRLCSSGGRPSDPEWTIRRLVPFKQAEWQELERLAEQCAQQGQRLSPSQLAAVLIERGIDELKKSEVA